jgi:hypothetical protein
VWVASGHSCRKAGYRIVGKANVHAPA